MKPRTTFQLANADSESLKPLTDKHGLRFVQMLQAVARIPYTCGRQDCHHPGCVEIRTAQSLATEIINED